MGIKGKPVPLIDGKKECTECNELKVLEDFYKKSTGPHGRTNMCKDCTNLKRKEKHVPKVREDKSLLTEKVCAKCKILKPRSEFRSEKRNANGMSSRCRDCMMEDAGEKRPERVKTEYELLLEQGLKKCVTCDEIKPLDLYYARNAIKSGVQSSCKGCMDKAEKTRRELERKERLEGEKELQAEWDLLYPNQRMCSFCAEIKDVSLFRRGENTPTRFILQCNSCYQDKRDEYWNENYELKIKPVRQKYYNDNLEKMTEYSAKRYQENKDLRRAQNKEWQLNNPEAYKELCKRSASKRRAIMANVPNTMPYNWWSELLEYYGEVCANPECDKEITASNHLTHDHIIPLSWEGSSNSLLNSQVLCKSCNSKKKNWHSTDYRDWTKGILLDDLTIIYDKIEPTSENLFKLKGVAA